MDTSQLKPGHIAQDVCALLSAGALQSLPEDQEEVLDYYLSIPGIDSWFQQVQEQQRLEEQHRLRLEEEKRNQEALTRKVKSDRLAAIRSQLGKPTQSTGGTSAGAQSSASQAPGFVPPTSKTAPPQPRTQTFHPTENALETCPHHHIRLVQTRDRVTGKKHLSVRAFLTVITDMTLQLLLYDQN